MKYFSRDFPFWSCRACGRKRHIPLESERRGGRHDEEGKLHINCIKSRSNPRMEYSSGKKATREHANAWILCRNFGIWCIAKYRVRAAAAWNVDISLVFRGNEDSPRPFRSLHFDLRMLSRRVLTYTISCSSTYPVPNHWHRDVNESTIHIVITLFSISMAHAITVRGQKEFLAINSNTFSAWGHSTCHVPFICFTRCRVCLQTLNSILSRSVSVYCVCRSTLTSIFRFRGRLDTQSKTMKRPNAVQG